MTSQQVALSEEAHIDPVQLLPAIRFWVYIKELPEQMVANVGILLDVIVLHSAAQQLEASVVPHALVAQLVEEAVLINEPEYEAPVQTALKFGSLPVVIVSHFAKLAIQHAAESEELQLPPPQSVVAASAIRKLSGSPPAPL